MDAKTLKSCLIEIQCVCESNEAILVSNLSSSFRFLTIKLNISAIKFMS